MGSGARVSKGKRKQHQRAQPGGDAKGTQAIGGHDTHKCPSDSDRVGGNAQAQGKS
jgi:hypothetical protein